MCHKIDDPKIKEKIRKFENSFLIENIGLFYSANIYTGFFFLITSIMTYFYLERLFQENQIISFLLLLIVVAYIAIYYQNHRLAKSGSWKRYISHIRFPAIIVLLLAIFIEIYGNYSNIPPFISITNTSQFSPLLFEHFEKIPNFPLSLVVLIYIFVMCLVLTEYFFSSKYIEKINQKLVELFALKYKIDRFQLGVTSDLNIDSILRKLPKLRINPPQFLTFYGIISIPIPLDNNRCEEKIYIVLEDDEL